MASSIMVTVMRELERKKDTSRQTERYTDRQTLRQRQARRHTETGREKGERREPGEEKMSLQGTVNIIRLTEEGGSNSTTRDTRQNRTACLILDSGGARVEGGAASSGEAAPKPPGRKTQLQHLREGEEAV